MVALSSTLLVVYQICGAKHDGFLFSRGDTVLGNIFLDRYLVILHCILWTDG